MIAERLLDVRYSTLREMDSPYDDAYTREATVFGRSRNMLIELSLSGVHDWLTLASPAMDVTIAIGRVPCRFFRDDPESPDKANFFKRNAVDDLFSLDENAPVMWRFVVEKAMTEDDEDRVFFIGYNVYQEKVSQWAYGASDAILHAVDDFTPPAKDIPPAAIEIRDVRERDQAQNE